MVVNLRDAKVTGTPLLEAILDPGAGFPAINSMLAGQYVCHLQYRWLGMFAPVPLLQMWWH
jgi:hypothetical protein